MIAVEPSATLTTLRMAAVKDNPAIRRGTKQEARASGPISRVSSLRTLPTRMSMRSAASAWPDREHLENKEAQLATETATELGSTRGDGGGSNATETALTN